MQGLAKQLCFRADHKRKEAEELICPTLFCFLISFRVCTMASHLCPVYQGNEVKIKSRVTLEGKIISQMCKTQNCSHKIEGENCSALFLVLNLKSYFCVAQFWGFWVCVWESKIYSSQFSKTSLQENGDYHLPMIVWKLMWNHWNLHLFCLHLLALFTLLYYLERKHSFFLNYQFF